MFGRSCSVSAAFWPLRLGLLVDHAGLLPLLDVADDDAVADHHLQRVDGAARRQRIDVDRLDPVLGRVAEDLGDAGAHGRAGDREVDVDAEPGRVGVRRPRSSAAASRSGVAGLVQGRRRARPPTRPAQKFTNRAAKPIRSAATACDQKEQDNSRLARQASGRAVGLRRIVVISCSRGAFRRSEIRREARRWREQNDRQCLAALRRRAGHVRRRLCAVLCCDCAVW